MLFVFNTFVVAFSSALVALSEQLKAIERNTPSLKFYFEHEKIALGYFSGHPSLVNYIFVVNTEASEGLLLHLDELCVSCDGAITLCYSYEVGGLTVEAMQKMCEQILSRWSEFRPNDRICRNARAHPLSVTFSAIGLSTEWVGTLTQFNSISYTGILMTHGIFIVAQISNVNFAFVQMNDGKIINAGLLVNRFGEVIVCYKCSSDVIQFCTPDGAFSLAFMAELTNTVNRLLENNQLINREPLMILSIKAQAYGSEPSSSAKAVQSEAVPSVKADTDIVSDSSKSCQRVPTDVHVCGADICSICDYLNEGKLSRFGYPPRGYMNFRPCYENTLSPDWRAYCFDCCDNKALCDAYKALVYDEHVARIQALEDASNM